MGGIKDWMTEDHRRCEVLFTEAEQAVTGKDWRLALDRYHLFRQALEGHLQGEEGVLFPALTARHLPSHGPVHVMESEHLELRDLLTALGDAIRDHDAAGCTGISETLLLMMSQHDLKEEEILYPMADQVLAKEAPQVLKSLQSLASSPVSTAPPAG
jgi:iron-sulfur cluster repair protein YtfE (RIC family)